MATSQNVRYNGSLIEVREREGEFPAVIFIHGSSMSCKSWEKQLNSSILNGHHLLAIDLLGHGDSSRSLHPEQDYTITGYVKSLQHVIKKLKIPNYILVGWSLGGNISLEALPESNGCLGVFLTATSIAGKPAALDQIFNPHPAMAYVFKERCTGGELAQIANMYFAEGHDSIPDFIYEDFKRTDPKFRSTLINSVVEGKHLDEISIVKKSTVPVAYTIGEGDQLINLSYLQNLNLPFWREEVHFVENAGHVPQWDNPVQYNTLLEDFVKDCVGPVAK